MSVDGLLYDFMTPNKPSSLKQNKQIIWPRHPIFPDISLHFGFAAKHDVLDLAASKRLFQAALCGYRSIDFGQGYIYFKIILLSMWIFYKKRWDMLMTQFTTFTTELPESRKPGIFKASVTGSCYSLKSK